MPCLYVPVMDYEDVSKEYSWQMPPAAGELFWIAREEAVRPFDFKRNGDPRCTAAFGEPFKSCSDLQPFAYTSEHAFVVSMLKARPDLLAAGVLGKIRVDAVSSQDVGWDFLWTEFDMLGADAYILVSEVALLATEAKAKPAPGLLAPQPTSSNSRVGQAGEAPAPDGGADLNLLSLLDAVATEQEKTLIKDMGVAAAAANREEDAAEDAIFSDASDDSDESAGAAVEVASESDDGIAASSGSCRSSDSVAEVDPFGILFPPAVPVAERSLEQVTADRALALDGARAPGFKGELLILYGLILNSFDVHDKFSAASPIGRLQPCFQGTSMCATCHVHGSGCKFILTHKPLLGLSLLHVEADLLAWLAAATVVDRATHFSRMQRLKREDYRMKVRC